MSDEHRDGIDLPDRALDGVRVLDLGQIYNGSYCGLLLAHLGADVIKVEPPTGESTRWRSANGASRPFLMLNSNKRGLAVDLRHPAGRDILLRLAADSDVLIENFAAGTMDRLGLGYDAIAKINGRLVYASGKGYSAAGSKRDRPAMDLTVQADTGVLSSTGFPDGPPVKAGVAVADFMGGVHLAMSRNVPGTGTAACRCARTTSIGSSTAGSPSSVCATRTGRRCVRSWDGRSWRPKSGTRANTREHNGWTRSTTWSVRGLRRALGMTASTNSPRTGCRPRPYGIWPRSRPTPTCTTAESCTA